MKKVGRVLDAATPKRFLFEADPNFAMALHDFVFVEVNELVEGDVVPLQVLAEVIELEARARANVLGTEVLGYLDQELGVLRPKSAPNPGKPVFQADSKTLQPYFEGVEKKIPIEVGELVRMPGVKVPIHLQEAPFHIGIFAEKKAGKSHLAGKIIEEILEKTPFPVIVVDINGDYIKMDQLIDDGSKHELFKMVVYQPTGAPSIETLTAEQEKLKIGFITRTLQPKTLSVICLSGLRAITQDSLTAAVIDLVFKHQISMKEKKPERFVPAFLFIEEAHRVLSSEGEFAEKLSNATKEGAKYGLFFGIISQRPRSIDHDFLSNIGNYAVLRITNAQDQHIIESVSEGFSHRLVEDLSTLNQGEAILVGPFVPLPARVKVIKRKTGHRVTTQNLYEIKQKIIKNMNTWEQGLEIEGENIED